MKSSRIAVIDSGVGGLSVLESIRRRLPHCEYIYFADSENFPYGSKDDAHVRACVAKYAGKIMDRYAPDVLVVACNTASTVALDSLRELFSIPIVGVVPALKPAAQRTETKCIGLLATPATVARAYTDQLIRDHCQGVEVIRVGSARLAEIAEYKLAGGSVSLEEIRREIAPFFANANPDIIVLGCTHFPLLKQEFQHVSPIGTEWIDSGEAIASRVQSLLEWQEIADPYNTVCISGRVPIRSRLVNTYRTFGFSTVEMI